MPGNTNHCGGDGGSSVEVQYMDAGAVFQLDRPGHPSPSARYYMKVEEKGFDAHPRAAVCIANGDGDENPAGVVKHFKAGTRGFLIEGLRIERLPADRAVIGNLD